MRRDLPGEKFRIEKYTKQKVVYYEIFWSPLYPADKYFINRQIPARSGVFELYWANDQGLLNLYLTDGAFFGGLRHKIREKIDPFFSGNIKYKEILEERDIYFRYFLIDSVSDSEDLYQWFANNLYKITEYKGKDSGRYSEIQVKENPEYRPTRKSEAVKIR